ncbi:MFS transporter [Phyllosticta citribraziliensis]|uniref:MFS transporter n=1 Tax=Phyllosticta citribraziliensis TaxID=989973 RepID=A0ABR1LQV7_9PEZI
MAQTDDKPPVDLVEYLENESTKDGGVETASDKDEAAWNRHFRSKDEEYIAHLRKGMLRKVNIHLLPLLGLMYLLNFLDRSNLAQARLGTLEKDLNMKGSDFNLATSILFVGYILMQLPSNLLLTRIRPSLYLGICMAIWGTISTAQAGAHTFGGLVAARFFLGFAEAPFFPGAIFLMSSWYTRAELANRISWFYVGATLANAFGGLLGAGVLGNLEGAHGISGWRYLFIIEGAITIAFAVLCAFVLPDYPMTTRWLTQEERAFAAWRLAVDVGEGDEAKDVGVLEGLMMALKDPKLYVFVLFQHCSLLTQAFQYFLPTIVKTLGYNNITTLLITAPVWVLTFFAALAVTFSSGRTGDRSIHIACLSLVSLAGNVICVSTLSTPARFFGMFLMPLGAIPAYQILLAWLANTFPRPLVKRSATLAICNLLGNASNIYAPYMYPSADSPRYIAGGIATAAVSGLVAILAICIRFWLAAENRKLDRAEADEFGIAAVDEEAEVRATGGAVETENGDVRFRYIL